MQIAVGDGRTEDVTASEAWRVYRKHAAYQFLLELASGLHSAIRGETNVFGQLRSAWQDFDQREPVASRALAPVRDALFRDTREIRTRFLQGIGGQSYATLARRLLQAGAGARVLIVGHGALGRSMVPKFAELRPALFNRTLPPVLPAVFSRLFSVGEEAQAVEWASHIVLCVPRVEAIDRSWVPLIAARPSLRTIHLGCRRDARGDWGRIPGLIDLDDVFELERSQTRRRSRQLELAADACAALASCFETDKDPAL